MPIAITRLRSASHLTRLYQSWWRLLAISFALLMEYSHAEAEMRVDSAIGNSGHCSDPRLCCRMESLRLSQRDKAKASSLGFTFPQSIWHRECFDFNRRWPHTKDIQEMGVDGYWWNRHQSTVRGKSFVEYIMLGAPLATAWITSSYSSCPSLDQVGEQVSSRSRKDLQSHRWWYRFPNPRAMAICEECEQKVVLAQVQRSRIAIWSSRLHSNRPHCVD